MMQSLRKPMCWDSDEYREDYSEEMEYRADKHRRQMAAEQKNYTPCLICNGSFFKSHCDEGKYCLTCQKITKEKQNAN